MSIVWQGICGGYQYRPAVVSKKFLLTFGTGILHLIQTNQQPNVTIF
jgi:hypothetical protein